MVKIFQTGAFVWCARANDVDSASLLQGKRVTARASASIRACEDDPDCTPLDRQCCGDWFANNNTCGAHRIRKLHTHECTPSCTEPECCEPKPFCGDDGQPGCPDMYNNKYGFESIQCDGHDCQRDECCEATCEAVLNGGECPATHETKTTLQASCPGCSHDDAVSQCCRPAMCADRLTGGACPDQHIAKADDLTGLSCGDCQSQNQAVDTCCNPTCEYALQGGSCPSTHVPTKSLQSVCPGCDHDGAVAQCCAPATCGDTLSKACHLIENHAWEDDKDSFSPCIVGDQPCNNAQAFHECCKTVPLEEDVTPPTMKYCTLHGDPHIRTFDNKDFTGNVPQPNSPAFQRGKKWLVNHPRVKIQGLFIGANGASTLGGLAIKVDDVFVRVRNPPSVRVNGETTWDSQYFTLLEGDAANLNFLGYNAYQTWGHSTIQQAGNSNWHKLYMRFPLFKDNNAERSYVEVYVHGQTNHLDAAIFMMKGDDFAARGMSSTFTGLCGNNDGNKNNDNAQNTPANADVSDADDLFEHINENPMPWPIVSQCSDQERVTFQGLCDSCLDSNVPDRENAILDCVTDRCAGEPEPESYMDCEFLNSLR